MIFWLYELCIPIDATLKKYHGGATANKFTTLMSDILLISTNIFKLEYLVDPAIYTACCFRIDYVFLVAPWCLSVCLESPFY